MNIDSATYTVKQDSLSWPNFKRVPG